MPSLVILQSLLLYVSISPHVSAAARIRTAVAAYSTICVSGMHAMAFSLDLIARSSEDVFFGTTLNLQNSEISVATQSDH